MTEESEGRAGAGRDKHNNRAEEDAFQAAAEARARFQKSDSVLSGFKDMFMRKEKRYFDYYFG